MPILALDTANPGAPGLVWSRDRRAPEQTMQLIAPSFTLNAGLRWEEFTPLANKGSMINTPVLGPAGSEFSGIKMVLHNHTSGFQPRDR
jgi:hypothetical protein